ncbi:MAG: bifunctional riboflavin kinase/FAD synthetase [Bacteroidales bacterium]|nr:bifunctional riboflavin kinase/FAD synthetase [Bacteroidales bacterium]
MAVVATGFFDGVHPGHRLVIETLLSEARARGEQSLVVTFWPHPRAVLQSGADSLHYLTSRAERVEMLKALGVDGVETIPFTRGFAALSAEQYVRMLCRDFQCTALVLGYDTRFGAEQAGPEEIAALAAGMGLDAVITPPVCVDGAPVSSTRIRAALEAGDVALASRLLGRPYRLHGVVVPGNRLGRTIGFPTANIKLYEPLMCIPRNGVYSTSVFVEKQTPYRGMTNIGVRPTVSDKEQLTIETYIFDFDEMIYGLDLTVDFISRIRDERKFASLEDLRFQLTSDAAFIRTL